MDAARWDRLEEICHAALLRSGADRAALLDEACGGDTELRSEALELIAQLEGRPGFLDVPLVRVGEAVPAEAAPAMVGPYRVVRPLGHGGMGDVLLATRDVDGVQQPVAIKLIRRGMDSDEILRRFQQERRILASLHHPGIAQLQDGGATAEGRPWLVMEYVEGEPLDVYCERRQLSLAQRLKLIVTICGAVQHAHRNLIVQASQRVNIRDVMESTVSFIELPNDELKGRIIGKEGRNIRALEMATGIDLIVDDTPRSIWISSFDPVRREVARVAIDRLLQDGRIHPARIEEVVQQVSEGIESLIEEKGAEAAFSLGLSDLNPKLVRLVGKMRYHTSHGQNLLQHALETAMIAGFMAQELGGKAEVVRRAGLLHEIGQVAEGFSAEATILTAADLSAKYQESDEVVLAIRGLHPDNQPSTLEALLLHTANRVSESRPGARKENLAVFIERLRRLEAIAVGFPGVRQAYAVKAGKELRVIIDAERTQDGDAYHLSKQIARALERELSYPGQIKVSVVRETRAVRFAV